MTTATIHVAMALNDAYGRHAGVMMKSLLRHADPAYRFVFHIITGAAGLSTEIRSRLAACLERAPSSIEYLPVNEERFAAYPLTSYYSIEVYYRLAIPELLPAVDKCLYLDADLVIRGDIAELWRIDLEGYALAAVRDRALELSATPDNAYRRLKLPRYFNAGVLAINLSWWRRHDVGARCARFLAEQGAAVRFQDQDALNVVLAGNILSLPPCWNVGIGYGVCASPAWGLRFVQLVNLHAPSAFRRALLRHPKIYHFGGGPWFSFPPKAHVWPYWREVLRTPWRRDFTGHVLKICWQIAAGCVFSLAATVGYRLARLCKGDGYRYAEPYPGYQWLEEAPNSAG